MLLALLHLRENAYGVTIRREIARRAARDVTLGTVYKTLLRMEEKGLVSSQIPARRASRTDPVIALRHL